MKKYTVILLFFFLLTSACYSQVKVDSTKAAELVKAAEGDLKNRFYREGIEKLTQALPLFGEANYRDYGNTLMAIGFMYSYINIDTSVLYFLKSEPYVTKTYELKGEYKSIIDFNVQLGWNYYLKQDYEKALSLFNSAEELILTNLNDNARVSFIYTYKGRIYSRLGKPDLGAEMLERGLLFARKSNNPKTLISALSTYASFLLDLGQNDLASEYYYEMLQVSLETYEPNDNRLASVYGNIARLEQAKQEYEKARNSANKALQINKLNPNIEPEKHGFSLYNLAVIENNLGEYDSAFVHIEKALEKYKEASQDITYLLPYLSEKTRTLGFLGNNNEAWESIKVYDSILNKESIPIYIRTNALMQKAIVYRDLKKYDVASQVFNLTINLLKENFTNSYSPLAQTYYEYSLMAELKNDPDSAIALIDQALINNTREIVIGGIKEVKIISGINHLLFLREKSRMLESSESLDQMIAALEVLDQAFEYIKTKRATSVGTQFTIESTFKIRNQAITLCHKLYNKTRDLTYLNKAFLYGELAKSQQLYEWTISSAISDKPINHSSQNSKKEIEKRLVFYENLMPQLDANDSLYSEKMSAYSDSIFNNRQKLFDIVAEIKKSNSAYYKAIYEEMAVSVVKVKSLIDSDEQLISYHLTDSALFVITIGSNSYFEKLDPTDLTDRIREFREHLMNPDTEEYRNSAKILFNQIINPLTLSVGTKKLNIISDGSLAYIPFELLLDQDKFLFEKFQIKYSYSANSLLNRVDKSNNYSLVAFAPEFAPSKARPFDLVRNELGAIPGALNEANEVANLFEGDAYISSEATESNFKSHAKKHSIVHLATHAVVDDDKPETSRLIFDLRSDSINDGNLYANEIYNLTLNAQLVTLSACNTGFGKIRNGEGVMSLSRAFAYAGVPATVVSLWPASDKSTPELMKYFYQNLKDGQAKDVALNNARKQYLATAKGKARHPFYWGGFVLIGDNSPIEDDANLLVYLIPSVLVIVMILTVYRRKKQA